MLSAIPAASSRLRTIKEQVHTGRRGVAVRLETAKCGASIGAVRNVEGLSTGRASGRVRAPYHFAHMREQQEGPGRGKRLDEVFLFQRDQQG